MKLNYSKAWAGGLLVWLCLALFPGTALAKKVYSPNVTQGEVELETQSEYLRSKDPAKNGKGKHQLELSYGFTDRWHSGVYIVYANQPGSTLKYQEAKWANILQLTEQGSGWMDVGFYIEYIRPAPRLAEADVLEVKVLFEKKVTSWTNRLNLVFKQPLWGNSKSTGFGYAWRTHYKLDSGLELGMEAYGGLGNINHIRIANQTHLIGPVLAYEVEDGFEIDFGWLMDTREGPAYGDFKLNLEYEF